MTDIAMVVFLCLNAVPHNACDATSAVWVMRPVERYPTAAGCAVASMQMLPILEDADDATHPVIQCHHAKQENDQ